jgi:Putative endonuclease, protein of unknown function (DUF1780)
VTHDEEEALWLGALRADSDDTVDLLSSRRKQERERRTCAAFLRCAGIEVEPGQVIASNTEPPDVLFESARFEIAIVMPQRKMHGEWKATARRRAEAQGINELIEPYYPSERLSRQQLIELILPTVNSKAQKYGANGTRELDLLLYINQNVVLDVKSPNPRCDEFAAQGWRSVSVLVPPHSYVAFARETSPEFIYQQIGKASAAWTCPDGLFDI